MSADNWTDCPKCSKASTSKVEELERRIEESYGKVSMAEYNQLLKERDESRDGLYVYEETTLREDYEFFGADLGVLNISYYCSCSSCGFTFSYEKSVDVFTGKEVS